MSRGPQWPPELPVPMSPVRGDLVVTSILGLVGAPVPVSSPGEINTMFSGPRGSVPGPVRWYSNQVFRPSPPKTLPWILSSIRLFEAFADVRSSSSKVPWGPYGRVKHDHRYDISRCMERDFESGRVDERIMAGPEGFEPSANGLRGHRSNLAELRTHRPTLITGPDLNLSGAPADGNSQC